MDYKKILIDMLMSDSNINHMVNMVLNNYKINKKVSDKCANFIKTKLKYYSNNIDRYPENKIELTQALSYLNKKCYEDFEKYLTEKYPNQNLKREHLTNIPQQQSQTVKHEVINDNNKTTNEYPGMIIIDEDEAKELIKKSSKNRINEDFLQYLANPAVIQSLCSILSHINHLSQIKNIKIDEILTEEQVKKILDNESKKSTDKNSVKVVKQNAEILPIVPIKENIDDSITEDVKEIDDIYANKTKKEDNKNTITFSGDISIIDNDMLIKIKDHIEHLIFMKNDCSNANNSELLQKIENEQKRLINVISEHKNKMVKTIEETQKKIETMKIESSNDDEYENLHIEIDPLNNYEDMKKIIIKLNNNDNKRLSEIILVSYHIHSNEDNITRFNNTFVINHNDNIEKYFIPTGNYDLDTLLRIIENKVMYLKFSEFNGKIKVVNKYDLPFDLDISNDSIFSILGFVGNASKYKGEKEYTASRTYALDSNKKATLSIGMSTDPIELQFDEKVEVNKVIKKFKGNGVSCNQIRLSFLNSIEQYYDFNKPIEIFLRFKWV